MIRIAFSDNKFEPITIQTNYKVHMKLILRNLDATDYGLYKCISKNSIGETDGTINVYRMYLFRFVICFLRTDKSLSWSNLTFTTC